MIYYTGVGSRELPLEVYNCFIKIGTYLATIGIKLRSGGASGSDEGFEKGVDISPNPNLKDIYVPWDGFNNSDSRLIVGNNDKAKEIAKEYHTHWENLNYASKKLATRNVFQVLGDDLNTPSEFLLCYTRNGSVTGGTALAINIAKAYNVPVFNAGAYDNLADFRRAFHNFLIEKGYIANE